MAPSILKPKQTTKPVIMEPKTHTFERMMEGTAAQHVPRQSYDVVREGFLRELSPLQKTIVLYLFDEEPKTAPEIAEGIDNKYDTVRHMLKRLQGKYNEADSKPKIKDLYPLVEEKENPVGRGYIYSLSVQTRKILSVD
jgi:DNA-binding MarR family transcriptional regulator